MRLLAVLTFLLAAVPAAGASPRCDQVAGNLIRNCDFAEGLKGWTSQAVTTLSIDARRGIAAGGGAALHMKNQPASEAGAATCVSVKGGATYELAGSLQRLDGPGECLALIEEYLSPGCAKGAAASHTVSQEPLVRGSFKEVRGRATMRADTLSVRAVFACYGETDDDVQSVLLDNVTLVEVESTGDR